jgi:2-oxoglutarate ferredoxin oxidoreductase subunit alpha
MGHNYCFVVEQNRDAQLKSLLVLETAVPKDRLQSILVYGGFPLSARHVVEPIAAMVLPEPQAPLRKTSETVRTAGSDTWE